jgi:hypothetical protein
MSSSNLSHYTVDTGDLRISPRNEVDERTLEMLTPIVRAGLGIIAGLSIVLETHRVDKDAEVWVFTLGFKPDAPAVRCWLSRTPNAEFWQFGVPEPPAPWLAVALLDEATNLTSEQVFTLGNVERCVAWACLELSALPC